MEGFEVGRRRPLNKRITSNPLPTPPFSEIDFFTENDSENEIKKALNKKAQSPSSKRNKKSSGGNPESNPHKVLPLIEVDLHIYELVDSTVGMDNYSMLQLQLDTVRKTMKNHFRRIGQKIVFIHGKGDGVLRKEVRKLLSKEYASCVVQDASFLKYGFGATEVTIRQR
ncbi:MAG: Smr/MutS family protein [Muribaculaceae bacterium]|nr:Smr/MutS family protein [Muribaculaceae bacterium]